MAPDRWLARMLGDGRDDLAVVASDQGAAIGILWRDEAYGTMRRRGALVGG